MKKYIFISYATEDAAFADWLYQKLTLSGYHVWLDKYCLKKGEAFLDVFPNVIKNETVRFLPILTEHSLRKENPKKERATAQNVKSSLGDKEFIVPIRLSSTVGPLELDHITVDLNWIDFSNCWATGLEELLSSFEENESIPKDAMATLSSNHFYNFEVKEKKESLYSNLLTIESLPTKIFCIKKSETQFPPQWQLSSEFEDCYYFIEGNQQFLEKAFLVDVDLKIKESPGFLNVFKSVLQKTINNHLETKGLKPTTEKGVYGFREDGKNKINYRNLEGKKAYLRTKGNVRISTYFLAAKYSLLYDQFSVPKIRINFKFNFFNEKGMPLPSKTAFKKQSKLRKSHYNFRWLAKILALASFFTQGQEMFILCDNACGKFIINGKLDLYNFSFGIDETDEELTPTEELNLIKESHEHESIIIQ